MNLTQHKFYTDLLKNGEAIWSRIPITIRNSAMFNQLLNGKIISEEKSGKGRKIFINKKESFETWLSTQTNTVNGSVENKSESIQKFKNSKAQKTIQKPFFFLRGFRKIKLENIDIDLEYFTKTFGAFVCSSLNFNAEKICVVENKESFLKAETLLQNEYIFVHKYGRWNTNDFKQLNCKSLLVFSDFDLIGLDEFLKIKSVITNAAYYFPENYSELFEKYATAPKGTITQIQSDIVKSSNLKEVVEVRESILKNNKFLEQEALFLDI